LDRRPVLPTFVWVIPLALVLFAGLTWLNYQYAGDQQGANDFLPGWEGTRLYFTEGLSPYSQETTAEIQKMAYGRPAAAGENPLNFTYPFYAILVFGPFAVLSDFALARALWMSILEVSILLIVITGVNLSRVRLHWLMYIILAIFSVLWFPGIKSILDGNSSIVFALLVVVAFWAIYHEQDALAATLLALASFRPQMILVLILFVLIWSLSRKRMTLFWGYLGVMALLIAATSLLIPNWIFQYFRLIIEQLGQIEIGTPRALFLYYLPGIGNQLAWLLTMVSAVFLLWEWRLAAGMNYRWFLWAAYFSLVWTNMIGLPTSVENQIALLPALILVLAVWDERWGTLGRWLNGFSILLLSVGLWWLVIFYAGKNIPADLGPFTFFMVPVFMVAGLYWVRWWAIRSPRLPLQEISERLG